MNDRQNAISAENPVCLLQEGDGMFQVQEVENHGVRLRFGIQPGAVRHKIPVMGTNVSQPALSNVNYRRFAQALYIQNSMYYHIT